MCVYKYVWNHRTGKPTPLMALSAGTSLTLCGVTPVAAHCSVLELKRLPHTQSKKKTYRCKHTDLLYTHSSHGWFSGEAGLEVAQDFLHTLTEYTVHNYILCYIIKSNCFHTVQSPRTSSLPCWCHLVLPTPGAETEHQERHAGNLQTSPGYCGGPASPRR